MLLNRNVVKSNNFFLWETYLRAQTLGVPWNQVLRVIHAVCAPLVPYSLKIYIPFMASSPQLSG